MATQREKDFDGVITPAAKLINKWFKEDKLKTLSLTIAWFILHEAPIKGWNGAVSLSSRIAGMDQANNESRKLLLEQGAILKNLVGLIAAQNKGEAIDPEKLYAGVRESAEQGVRDSIQAITTTTVAEVREP